MTTRSRPVAVARRRSALVVSLLALLAVAIDGAALAADPFVGTWVLNTDKSSGAAGTLPTSSTVVVSDAGGGKYKSVSDTVAGGQTIHSEITFATDGSDSTPVTNVPMPPNAPKITQSFERVNASTYKATLKMNGEPVADVVNEVSQDGKTLTVRTTGVGAAAGISSVAVFERK